MCLAVVPHPMGMILPDEVRAKADAAVDEIISLATEWRPDTSDIMAEVQYYPARRFNFTGTYAELNDFFQRRNWSLSLPIVPPTLDAVAAMLEGTSRDPSEVVWVVPPRNGILTVELVAALGVMAGAKPEHMPLLLAAVEAFSDSRVNWRGTSTTTNPAHPMMIISGPITEVLGLNVSTGVIGPQNPTTAALGYFLNLVGDVVGGSVRPHMDMSSHGTAGDFVAAVFVENRAENPWGTSIAEDLGYAPTDNVLIAFPSSMPVGNSDHTAMTGQRVLDTIGAGLAGAGSGTTTCFAEVGDITSNATSIAMIMLGPEFAATIAKDFPNKEDATAYLAANAVLPFRAFQYCTPPEEFGSVTQDTLLPLYKNNNSINFVVSGGPGKQAQIWPIFPTVHDVVSVKIEGY